MTEHDPYRRDDVPSPWSRTAEEQGSAPSWSEPAREPSPWWATNAQDDPWRDPESRSLAGTAPGNGQAASAAGQGTATWTAPTETISSGAPGPTSPAPTATAPTGTARTATAPTQPLSPAHDPWSAPSASGGAGWGGAASRVDPWSSPPVDAHRSRFSGRRGTVRLAALVLATALLGGTAGAVTATALDDDGSLQADRTATLGQGTGAASTARPPTSVAGIAQRVLPSVVSIEVRRAGGQGTGSGVILRSDGLILTNNHVVDAAADGGQIQVAFSDGETASATIVGRDPTSDLAVLRASRTGLPAAALGRSSTVTVGDPVVAIGSPLGLAGTVTSGIVSAKDRPVRAGGADTDTNAVIDAIQTDAAINPGNSGGALVDAGANVIGINSAIATVGGSGGQSGNIGLGFAIPIDQARSIAEEIIRTGKATHPYIGVQATTSTEDKGAQIRELVPDAPAERAGLQPGDLITEINGTPIASVDDLIVAIRKNRIGDTVKVRYERDGQERTATLQLQSDENAGD